MVNNMVNDMVIWIMVVNHGFEKSLIMVDSGFSHGDLAHDVFVLQEIHTISMAYSQGWGCQHPNKLPRVSLETSLSLSRNDSYPFNVLVHLKIMILGSAGGTTMGHVFFLEQQG